MPGLVRYRFLYSGPNKRSRREYYMEDVRALLTDPSRKRGPSFGFTPKFHREGTAASACSLKQDRHLRSFHTGGSKPGLWQKG